MGVRESLLNTITSVADSDFVRIVTSAGASSKATVRNLFKGFESNLGAKSSLSDSDYIRVVGSDNEAYKQSLSAMKTFMGSAYVNSITSFNDLINSLQNGQPFVASVYSAEVLTLLSGGALVSPRAAQIFGSRKNSTTSQYQMNVQDSQIVYLGTYDISTGTVSSVSKMPTRDEVDALKNTATGSFILDSAQSDGNANGLSIKQCGKVVSVNGYISGLTLQANTYIGKISGVSLPPTAIRFYCNVGANAYSTGTPSYIYIDPSSGGINIQTTNVGSNKAVYFSVTYIAN